MTGCLDEAAVLGFLAGTLPPAARGAVETHVAACSGCAEILTWAAADSANASRAPGREGAPFLGQLAPGARVDRYQVLTPIGRGGMGEVYAAYHPDLDRRIALKIVFESGGDAAERRARLLREARAIARLSHPNVIAVFDAGTVGDRVYIAMEFVDGETVDVWLHAKPRGWQEILDVFVVAGRGLAAAHAAGIIHRDFKPQNVMIAKDGAVRVMDFGLAQLVREDAVAGSSPGVGGEADSRIDSQPNARPAGQSPSWADRPPNVTRATKTGALLGTPAYMAPEQWRGEPIDARADQFSFCVALYEALFGSRPTLSHLSSNPTAAIPASEGVRPPSSQRGSPVPGWLKTVLARGLTSNRDLRFSSMEEFLATLTRSRTRTRRRASGLAALGFVALATYGGWRLSHARRFDCAAPDDRISNAWAAGETTDPRRAAIHKAFATSGRADAETIWRNLSSALDGHMGRWTTTYREACTATHVRGEQSEEILDLRMQCLSENLDEVRALTEALLSAQPSAVAQATTAVEQLSPVGRCSDIPSLRSAVPLPRDERTRRTVQELRRAVNDVSARLLLFQTQEALGRAIALRPAVEATGYRPLLAQLLEVTGGARIDAGSPEAEGTLEHALFEAEAGRDDETAARAAIDLVFEVGYAQAKPRQADVWANLASAILDRLGPGHEQLQSWLFQDRGIIRTEEGDFRAARHFFEQALMLKERTLGPDSPDVARTLTALAWVLNEEGSASEALVTNTRALAICKEHGISCSNATDNQGEILAALGRYTEAEGILKAALRLAKETRFSRDVAHPLTALAEVRMAQGDSRAAVQLLEQALLIREQDEPIPDLVAVTQFALARALWESGGDRHRARALAGVAADTFASHGRPNREKAARDWLGSHSAGSPSHP